jgi:hypothetical protein
LIGGIFGGSADNGLTIPGPIGAPRLIKAHGGETILPTHKSMAAGIMTPHVTYNIDARGAERGVSREIQRAIDISRRQAVAESQGRTIVERRRSNNTDKVF